jgi:arylesterase / paraoxonase
MRNSVRFALALLVVLLVGGSYFWWSTMSWTGELSSLRPHFDGTCDSVEGIVGAEDIVIDQQQQIAYISSHDRRAKESFGAIWMMPVGAPHDARAMKMTGYDAPLFSPHGIDLWTNSDGTRNLFVVEHGDWSQSRIVIFRVEEDTLVFERAITDPLIRRPNDVAAAGQNAFYVTNDLGAAYGSSAEFTEVLFRQKKGNLVYFDGNTASIAADKLGYANGVALSNDGKSVYVSAVIDQSVRFYARNADTGALSLYDEINLHSGVDNIDVDADGILWVAAHPKLLTFSKHAKNAEVRSPSQIIRIDPKAKTLREVYLSAGDPLSAASVAAHTGNTLLLGGVFDPRVLVCTMANPPA